MTKAVILASIVVGTILVALFLVIFLKPSIKSKYYKYFYAFTAGFMIIIGSLGLMHEARERINNHYPGGINGLGVLWAILIILGSGLFASLIIYWVKTLVNPPLKNLTKKKKTNHKWVAIILILMHRIPASLAIGFLAPNAEKEWALLLVIILHIIPEVLLVYYRQRDMGYSKLKSFTISLLIKLIFFPMIIVGAALENALSDQWWLQASLFAIAGFVALYGAVVEIIPEFINFTTPHQHLANHDSAIKGDALGIDDHEHAIIAISNNQRKVMLWLSCWLLLGISLAVTILTFHM